MFKKMKLDYDFDSLEPFIDTHTLGLHYNKHYENYLNKLNELLKDNNIEQFDNINDLIDKIYKLNTDKIEDILFNLGGVLNHELYFNSINSKKTKISNELKKHIEKQYGSFENFKKEFSNRASTLKGSGYTFLIMYNNTLDIVNFSNQITPYLYGLIPLLCIDLWEHAYYINYENRKNDYIENFFNIIDFENANNTYSKNMII